MHLSLKITAIALTSGLVVGILGAAQPVEAAAQPVAASASSMLPAAPSVGDTYYVDNSSGSNCSDSGTGTDPAGPWCTFTPAAALTLGEGDSLLLARGSAWSQQLAVKMEGASEHPATIGAYGVGAAPRILGNDSGRGIWLTDPDNAVVTGLDIGAKTESGAGALEYGVLVEYTSIGHENLVLEDLSVHDSRTSGIDVHSIVATMVDQTVLDGLTFSGIRTTHNAHGIRVAQDADIGGLSPAPGQAGEKVFRHILVDGIHQLHDDGNQPSPADVPVQIGVGCPDSLALINATDVVVRDSILDGSAGCRTTYGTAAVFLGRLQHVLIANNMIVNTPNTQNSDMVAIDHEAYTSDVTIAGNYFADNYGGAVEYLAIHGELDFSVDNALTSNVFVNNGTSNAIPYPGDGAIAQIGNGPIVRGSVADNLAYEPNGLLNAHLSGSTAGLTTSNNVLTTAADDIFHAAAQYDAKDSRWGYEHTAGTTWSSLPYDPSTSSYGRDGVSIDRFDVTPSPTASAGITWTAPSSGVISLRAFPVAHTDGATVTVTVNDEVVAEAEVGTAGANLTADDVSVRDGDVVRFAVAAGGGEISLAPAIAYTSQSDSTDVVGQWSFSVAGDAGGWTSTVPTSVRRGVVDLTTNGGTTTLDSASKLGLSATASSSLRLTYYNGTDATEGRIYFATNNGGSFSAKDSVAFSINPKSDTGRTAGYHSVLIPLSGNKDWKGKIQQLRISLADATGSFQIDSIELAKPSESGWEFDSAAGWTQNPNAECASGGTASADPVVDVDNTTGAFSTYADINWLSTRMQTFTVSTSRLAQVDFWAYQEGDPKGCLYFRVVKITDETTHKGTTLFTGAVPPSAVSAAGGFVSVYPGLTGLDTSATYGLQILNPYVIPGAGTYGVGYSDDASKPASGSGEYYSVDNGGIWHGPETSRSLKFRTYSAPRIAEQDANAGFTPVAVADGLAGSDGGYEPALRSPSSLEITAASTRYIHIRMNNPDNRQVAYLLFTSAADPTFDRPGDGWPVPEETGGKGVVFALEPGASFHDYTLDMSKVAGWKGTIEQLMIEPGFRWSYRTNGDLGAVWTGKIDYVRLDPGTIDASRR
ncbi:hypothetical protein [Microbacterium allomyrinae]|uniref:Right-handed parallel beta-helix repeat-containing protein n=1 Tax=Microbacterium allomyrinae TaxID=2830666 RepID=A0A9X1LTB9_9MICO|nr:hypothetical protein [Microbacterium allomyrinae]MCC2031585.1 hypothetical protein [Microbacterium allomyrinae]